MNQNAQRIRYILGDLLATAAGWLSFYIYRFDITGFLTVPTLREYLTLPQVELNLILGPLAWLALYAFSGYYQNPYFKSQTNELQVTFWTVVVGTLVAFFAMVIDDVPFINDENIALLKIVHISPKTYLQILLTMFGCVFVPVYLVRYFITHHVNSRIQSGRLGLRTLLIGEGKAAQLLQRELKAEKRQNGYLILRTVPDNATIDEIRRAVEEHHIEAFLLAPERHDARIINHRVYELLPFELPIRMKASNEEILNGQVHTDSLTSLPMIQYSTDLLSPFKRNLKRLADILSSVLALILLSPLFLVVAFIIRRDSPGPVFFSQERIGRSGKPFHIYKFRSMRTDAEKDGPRLSSTIDRRITRVGRYLRKYRIDELPQFWNVLRGDMSLVGPRPERDYYIRQIMDIAPYYSKLLQVRPGITSWGMVKYGYASTIFQMVERMRYDLMYINNCSIAVDLKILGFTVRTVLTGKGI